MQGRPRGSRTWVGRVWRANLSDPTQMAHVRARVVSGATALSALGVAGTLLVVRSEPGTPYLLATQLVVIGVLGALATAVLMMPRGLGDGAFAGVLVLGLVLAAGGVVGFTGQGDVPRTAVTFVIQVVIAASFLDRGRWVTGYWALSCGLLVAIGVHVSRAPAGASSVDPAIDVATALVALSVVTVSVRLLRGLALSAVEDARHRERTDPLTRLANRRGLEEWAPPLWRRRAAEGTRMAAMVVDVDHFKTINDTHGHAAGDDVLRRLGDLLSSVVRADDVAARLGGEEFVLLCQVHPDDDLAAVADRIRSRIERDLAPVTVSIGVHGIAPRSDDALPESFWQAVEAADAALYEAKRGGRNRVVTTG